MLTAAGGDRSAANFAKLRALLCAFYPLEAGRVFDTNTSTGRTEGLLARHSDTGRVGGTWATRRQLVQDAMARPSATVINEAARYCLMLAPEFRGALVRQRLRDATCL